MQRRALPGARFVACDHDDDVAAVVVVGIAVICGSKNSYRLFYEAVPIGEWGFFFFFFCRYSARWRKIRWKAKRFRCCKIHIGILV